MKSKQDKLFFYQVILKKKMPVKVAFQDPDPEANPETGLRPTKKITNRFVKKKNSCVGLELGSK